MPSKLSGAFSIADTLARDWSRQLSIFCYTCWVLPPEGTEQLVDFPSGVLPSMDWLTASDQVLSTEITPTKLTGMAATSTKARTTYIMRLFNQQE